MAATLQDIELVRSQPLFISYNDDEEESFGDEEKDNLDELGIEDDDDLDGDSDVASDDENAE
jgi:hypothetical protein